MSNIIYSNARAKFLSNRLLGNDRINRMIDSNLEDAIKILSEVNFGDNTLIESAFDFEKLIDVEKNNLDLFVKQTSPSENVKKFFLIKNDYHNAEAFIKEKYLKIDSTALLTSDGIYSKDYLKEKIMTDDYKKLSSYLEKALSICDYDFVNGKATGGSVNSVFVKSYFEELKDISKSNKYLKKIFNAKADFANVSIALRIRKYDDAKAMFVSGGKLTDFELRLLCEEQLDALKEYFKFNENSNEIIEAIKSLEQNLPLTNFEKMSESFAVKYLLKYRYETQNILPFIQYVYYKMADLNNVRIILFGLINKLNKNDIKEKLRAYYEG